MTPFECDLAVVGAGVAGLSAALRASKTGAVRVAVFERASVGAGGSGRALGLLLRPAMPFVRLVGALGAEGARALWKMAERGRAGLREVAERAGIRWVEAPSFRLAENEEEARSLRESAHALAEAGFEARWLDASELEREAGVYGVRGALRVEGEASCDLAALVRALAREAERANVAIREGVGVRRVRSREDLRVALELEDGSEAIAGRVVLATNARLGAFDPFGREAVTPVRGHRLRWEGGPPTSRAFLVFGWGRAFVRLDGAGVVEAVGLRLPPEPADFGLREEPDPAAAEALAGAVRAALPALRDARLGPPTAGPAGLPCDGLPFAGPHPRRPGVLIAAGFALEDAPLAFVAGEIVADLALEGRTDHPPVLSPRRVD